MVLDTEGRIVRFNRACEQTAAIRRGKSKTVFSGTFSIPQEVEKPKLFRAFARRTISY